MISFPLQMSHKSLAPQKLTNYTFPLPAVTLVIQSWTITICEQLTKQFSEYCQIPDCMGESELCREKMNLLGKTVKFLLSNTIQALLTP